MSNTKLYVITSIFNPMQFKSRSALFRPFAAHMKASGVELMTVEAAFGDHPFEVTTPENPWNIQLRTDQILWHKERLLNIGIHHVIRLVPDAKNFAWIDADTTFTNGDWAAETVHQLMKHLVVQPFGTAISLDSEEHPLFNCPSSFRAFLECRGYHQEPPVPFERIYKGHPGLATAATLEALSAIGGLYDVCVSGSGDTVMSNCLKGKWDAYIPQPISTGMAASIKQWAARCDKSIRTNIGYTRGSCLHHWHGKSEERGYEKRWSILSFHKFDPTEDLILDVNGLYRWAGNKPRLEDDIRLSLTSRNEDHPTVPCGNGHPPSPSI